MAIRPNQFNDPALGEAFGNIASIFAPPSAQDTLAYTGARAKRQEADRLSWLFENAADPRADRKAVMAGVYNPTQSFYAQDQNNATAQRGQDVTANTALQTNLTDNRFGLAKQYMEPRAQGVADPGLPSDLAQFFGVPEMAPVNGAPKPLSETEQLAAERQALAASGMFTPDMQLEQILGGETPVKIVRPDGQLAYSTPGAAARTGATAYADAEATAYENFSVIGANGAVAPAAGRVMPDGRILAPSGEDITSRVVAKAGVGGGTSLEVDGQGGIRFNTGGANTVATQTGLQGREIENERGAKEIVSLFDTLRTDDLGVRGSFNENVRTNLMGQIDPNLARPDVTARRNQLRATSANLAAAIMNDSRLSDSERALARQVSVSDGLDVSLPGAQAQLAQLAVLTLWQAEAARAQLAGKPVPLRDAAFVGALVDRGDIPPDLAELYMRNMVSGNAPPAAPAAPAAPTAPAAPAAGALPVVNTPEDAAKLPSGTKFQTPDGRVKVVP